LRVPSNAIGWVMETGGLFAAIAIFGGIYVSYDRTAAAGLPLVVPLAWLSTWIGQIAITLLVVYVPLLFPTGRYLGSRWVWVGIVGMIGTFLSTVGLAFAPGPLPEASWIDNPLGIAALGGGLNAAANLSSLAAPICFAAAIVSVFVRYRRADAIERAQLKWFGLVAAISVAALVTSTATSGPVSDFAWDLGLLTLTLVPVAIGIAVLRYRLWGIDRIVSRTVGWAILSGLLAVVFVALVVGLEDLLANVAQGSTLAVAASTLVAFALFQPLRRRVQAAVDRRFDRSHYDSEHTAAAFAERLRAEVDLDTVTADLVVTTRIVFAPVTMFVWLRRP
jgi:hypothetical protein